MLQDGGNGSANWCQLQESDELLQRQFEELSKGLQDEAPAVRITAASGICALLNTYWELIPAGITAAYLKHLAGVSAVTLPSCCSGHHFQIGTDGLFSIALCPRAACFPSWNMSQLDRHHMYASWSISCAAAWARVQQKPSCCRLKPCSLGFVGVGQYQSVKSIQSIST